MFHRPSFLVSVVVICAFAVHAFAGIHQDKSKKPRSEPYSVVKVDAEYRVIKKSGLKALRAELARDYKNAVKDYTAALKEARRSKSKQKIAKPKKAKLRVLRASCKDEAAADAFVEAQRAKDAKKAAGSTRGKKIP